jgi:hypothetical protein
MPTKRKPARKTTGRKPATKRPVRRAAETVDASYTSLDVGFDLRLHRDMVIRLPAGARLSVRYQDREDNEQTFTGTRVAVRERLRRMGYRVTAQSKPR